MSYVTEKLMFIPIPDNPLHHASSLKNPLPLTPSSPPLVSTSFSTLQKKSSFKDDIANSKHTVRWSSPISMSRVIPSRESDTISLNPNPSIPTQTISIQWSISQSLTVKEGTQCESITLLELEPHFSYWEKKESCSVLSFSRPRALLTQSEELQARMNLMHLHEVIQQKIFLSNTKSFTRQKRPSKTSRHPVFGSATSINIPKHLRSNQNSPARLRLKRRSTASDHKRPRKVFKTAVSFRHSDAPANDSDGDGFPNLRHVESLLDHLKDQPSSSAGHPWTSGRHSSVEPTSSSDDDDNPSDDGDEVSSDNESLIGSWVRDVTVPVRDNVTRRTQRSQFENSVSQGRGPQHPLNSIKVVNWTNGLKRFDYLLQNKKMDWRCDDELYELLKRIDVEKDNVTIELLKKSHVGKMIRDLAKCDKFEERSRFLAKRIYRSWLKMCREV